MSANKNNTIRKTKWVNDRQGLHMDLTPMVDLGFLLITFFILTTTMNQQRTTDLYMPKDSKVNTPVKESAVLTLIPLGNNQIEYYEGRNRIPGPFRNCSYGELRSVIQRKQEKVGRVLHDRTETTILIDPSSASTYQNFMDILDEIQINDIHHYFVIDHHGH